MNYGISLSGFLLSRRGEEGLKGHGILKEECLPPAENQSFQVSKSHHLKGKFLSDYL